VPIELVRECVLSPSFVPPTVEIPKLSSMAGGISIVDIGAILRAEISLPKTERLKHMSPAQWHISV